MVEFRELPVLADGQVMRASLLQDVWFNMNSLKSPAMIQKKNPGTTNLTWNYDSGTFADIDAEYYRVNFDSFGGDVLAIAQIRFAHEAANGSGNFAFMLDGVFYGNTLGLMSATDLRAVPEIYMLSYVFTGVPAGDHVLSVQWQDASGLNLDTLVYRDGQLGLWVIPF
jgi:hypothetical protein